MICLSLLGLGVRAVKSSISRSARQRREKLDWIIMITRINVDMKNILKEGKARNTVH